MISRCRTLISRCRTVCVCVLCGSVGRVRFCVGVCVCEYLRVFCVSVCMRSVCVGVFCMCVCIFCVVCGCMCFGWPHQKAGKQESRNRRACLQQESRKRRDKQGVNSRAKKSHLIRAYNFDCGIDAICLLVVVACNFIL